MKFGKISLYYNLFKDSEGNPIVEAVTTYQIKSSFEELKPFFIPVVFRINLKTGETVTMWKVIESDAKKPDASLDPKHLLTHVPIPQVPIRAFNEKNKEKKLILSASLLAHPFQDLNDQDVTCYDFRKKKELLGEAPPFDMWKGFPNAPSQDGQTVDPTKLDQEKGRGFCVHFNARDALKKEFEGEEDKELDHVFKADLHRNPLWCEKGVPLFRNEMTDEEKEKKARELFDKISKGRPELFKRAFNLTQQGTSALVFKLVDTRYGPTSSYDDKGHDLFPNHYNFYMDSSQTPFLEVTKTKYLPNTNTFIPYLIRINLVSGEAVAMWRVVESTDPRNDPSLDPKNLFTTKPL